MAGVLDVGKSERKGATLVSQPPMLQEISEQPSKGTAEGWTK